MPTVRSASLYDFVQNASSASWSSGAGSLTFPGNPSDNRGFALNLFNTFLEDGISYSTVLESHPEWVSDGYIIGRYPSYTITENSQLFVKTGFLSGATGSDGVLFEVLLEINQVSHTIISQEAHYDGNLDTISKSLNQYVGQTGNFILRVKAGQSSGQDWAVWAEARIEEINMPDLVVTDISLDGTTIGYKLKNIGSAAIGVAENPASFECILLVDGMQASSDSFQGTLDVDQELVRSFDYEFKATSSEHRIGVWADGEQKIAESDEENNYREELFSFGKPDLYAYAIRWSPPIATINITLHLYPEIQNIGSSDSQPCTGEFYVDDEIIGSLEIPSIPVGMHLSDVNSQLSLPWTPTKMGEHRISFTVDSSDEVDEGDESNNQVEETLDVNSSDLTEPWAIVYHIPFKLFGESINERDNVTIVAEASDPSGIRSITIYFNGMAKKTIINSTTCTYNAGFLPRLSTVFYAAQVRDQAGNIYLTPTRNFTVSSYYAHPAIVDIELDPPHPTSVDSVTFNATAYYPYGIDRLRIYLNGHSVAEAENATNLSIVRGPWATGYSVSYFAEVIDADARTFRTPEISFTVGELGSYNTKNMSSYYGREIFIASDLDWRLILQLVPVSIWKEMHPTEPVPVGTTYSFPVLLYHEENETSFDADSVIRFLQQYAEYGSNRLSMRITMFGDPPPELLRLIVAPPPVGAGLSEAQLRVWSPSEATSSPTILSLDPYSLAGGGPSEGVIRGLGGALRDKWGVDAHISTEDVTGIVSMDDLYTDAEEKALREEFWSDLNVYVLSEDEYSTALMASVYASLLNAPLILEGNYDLSELYHKSVYLVGSFTEEEVDRLRTNGVRILARFSLDELRRHYVLATGTNKLILVNPLDLWTSRRQVYYTDKGAPIEYLFGKHSLASPFLAAHKKEAIISISSFSYPEIDAYVKESFETLIPGPALKYLTILATPEAIPNSRANVHHPVSIHNEKIVYQGQRYIDTDIVQNNIRGDSENYLLTSPRMQYNPVCSSHAVVWVDEDTWGDIWYMTPSTGIETRLTGRETPWAGQSNPAIHDSTIVWQDHRGRSWDIYMCDISDGRVMRVSDSELSDENPAVWDDYIVWQRYEDGYWKIIKHRISTGVEGQISPREFYNYLHPEIWEDRVVFASNRGGGNWDIFMSNLSGSEEIRISDDEYMQWMPKIFGDRIVWQDNRFGDWDIYSYDLSTGVETRITREAIDQVLPNIWGDDLVWFEGSEDGFWYIAHYDYSTGLRRRIARTEVSADDGPLWLEVDGRYYGSINNLEHQDIATGRIYGITVSDASAYIARDLFYHRINKNKDALVTVREDHQTGIPDPTNSLSLEPYARSQYWTDEIEDIFRRVHFYAGHDGVDPNAAIIHDKYDESGLILFVDHGLMDKFESVMSTTFMKIHQVQLQPATVLDLACLTGAYYVYATTGNPSNIMAVQHLRRGAMVYMGATDVSYWHQMFDNLLDGLYEDGKTIGEIYLEARNEEYDSDVWNFSLTLKGDIYYTLYGDPTFQPKWEGW